MNWLHQLGHALGVIATAAASVLHPAAGSVSAGMQAGPVCITQTARPGGSYSAPVSVAGDTQNMRLSVQQIGPPAGPPYPAGGYPLPAAWVSFSGVSQVTVSVPGGAGPGRYGASLVATNYGSGSGSGMRVALGAAAATWLEISVGVSPPPRAFCTGQRPTYWPWHPVNWCKPGERIFRADPCTPRPLPPPVANAKNCGMTQAAWQQYMRQLGHGTDQYGKPMRQDAHCIVHGRLLNRARYYHQTGAFRWPDAPQPGQLQNARPADSP